MPKVANIIYYLDSGARIDYQPANPETISEDAMSIIIRLIDGEELSNICPDAEFE
jgi:hypothetical protein